MFGTLRIDTHGCYYGELPAAVVCIVTMTTRDRFARRFRKGRLAVFRHPPAWVDRNRFTHAGLAARTVCGRHWEGAFMKRNEKHPVSHPGKSCSEIILPVFPAVENLWEGKHLRLRAPTEKDLEGYFLTPEAFNTASQRSGDRVVFPVSPEQRKQRMEAFYKQDPAGDDYFLLMEARDGTAVGNINSHSADRLSGTFSYGIAVSPEHRGKGYASEAIRLLLRYFFDELGYQKCNAHVYDFNPDSMRLHERFGFLLEGRVRRSHYAGGRYCDVLHYGMTREEFRERYADSAAAERTDGKLDD